MHNHREAPSDSSVTTPVFSPKFAALEPKPSPICDLLPRRMIEDIRDEVAARLAVRVVCKIKPVDDMKVSVALTLSKQDDAQFLRIAALRDRHGGDGPITLIFLDR